MNLTTDKDGKVPVVFEIIFKGETGLLELTSETTAYPGEEEILVQDGLEYLIIDSFEQTTEVHNKKFRLIQLQYPA